MTNCLCCGLEHERQKYCSDKCQKKMAMKRAYAKTRSNPDLLKKYRLRQRNSKRKLKGIDVDLPPLTGERGKGNVSPKGYRRIYSKGHPNSLQKGSSRGMMFEHVFIMSEHLKRPLMPGENVHHKNGIRHDNRIENLELWSKSQPYGSLVDDKIQWCKEFLSLYGYEVSKKQVFTH